MSQFSLYYRRRSARGQDIGSFQNAYKTLTGTGPSRKFFVSFIEGAQGAYLGIDSGHAGPFLTIDSRWIGAPGASGGGGSVSRRRGPARHGRQTGVPCPQAWVAPRAYWRRRRMPGWFTPWEFRGMAGRRGRLRETPGIGRRRHGHPPNPGFRPGYRPPPGPAVLPGEKPRSLSRLGPRPKRDGCDPHGLGPQHPCPLRVSPVPSARRTIEPVVPGPLEYCRPGYRTGRHHSRL